MCPAIRNSPRKASAKKQPRKSQSERTEQALNALRKAAFELIVSEGVTKFKLADVGTRAGYSRGIVNYHFGTKNDLLADLLETTTLYGEAIFADTDSKDTSTIDKIFDQFCEMIVDQPDQLLGILRLIHEASCSTDSNLIALMTKYNQQSREQIASAIERAVGTRATRNAVNSEDQAKVVLGLIRGAASQWLVERDTFNIVRVLQLMKSQVHEALGIA